MVEMAVTQAFTKLFECQVIASLEKYRPELVALDGNLSEGTLTSVVSFCNQNGIPGEFTRNIRAANLVDDCRVISIFVSRALCPKTPFNHSLRSEPTSVMKSTRILPSIAGSVSAQPPIAFIAPNLLELAHMYKMTGEPPFELTQTTSWWSAIDAMGLGTEFRMELEQLSRQNACDRDSSKGTLSFLVDRGVAQMAVHLLPFIQHVVVKCGELGVLVVFRSAGTSSGWSKERSNVYARQVIAQGQDGSSLVLKHFPALPLETEQIVSVTGAGDSLVGSMLASLLQTPQAFQHPSSLSALIQHAQEVCSRRISITLYIF